MTPPVAEQEETVRQKPAAAAYTGFSLPAGQRRKAQNQEEAARREREQAAKTFLDYLSLHYGFPDPSGINAEFHALLKNFEHIGDLPAPPGTGVLRGQHPKPFGSHSPIDIHSDRVAHTGPSLTHETALEMAMIMKANPGSADGVDIHAATEQELMMLAAAATTLGLKVNNAPPVPAEMTAGYARLWQDMKSRASARPGQAPGPDDRPSGPTPQPQRPPASPPPPGSGRDDRGGVARGTGANPGPPPDRRGIPTPGPQRRPPEAPHAPESREQALDEARALLNALPAQDKKNLRDHIRKNHSGQAITDVQCDESLAHALAGVPNDHRDQAIRSTLDRIKNQNPGVPEQPGKDSKIGEAQPGSDIPDREFLSKDDTADALSDARAYLDALPRDEKDLLHSYVRQVSKNDALTAAQCDEALTKSLAQAPRNGRDETIAATLEAARELGLRSAPEAQADTQERLSSALTEEPLPAGPVGDATPPPRQETWAEQNTRYTEHLKETLSPEDHDYLRDWYRALYPKSDFKDDARCDEYMSRQLLSRGDWAVQRIVGRRNKDASAGEAKEFPPESTGLLSEEILSRLEALPHNEQVALIEEQKKKSLAAHPEKADDFRRTTRFGWLSMISDQFERLPPATQKDELASLWERARELTGKSVKVASDSKPEPEFETAAGEKKAGDAVSVSENSGFAHSAEALDIIRKAGLSESFYDAISRDVVEAQAVSTTQLRNRIAAEFHQATSETTLSQAKAVIEALTAENILVMGEDHVRRVVRPPSAPPAHQI